MKKVILFLFTIALAASCTTQKPLYSWANYNTASYDYLKNSDEKSTKELMDAYQTIIDKQKGARGVVPPGVYADYGFLLLQANKTKEGKEMLAREVTLYPESKIFIDRILKMIEK